MLVVNNCACNVCFAFKKAEESTSPFIFPTDTIYGIGAFIGDRKANLEISGIKGRSEDKPFPVLVSGYDQLEQIKVNLSEKQFTVIERYWPGAFTFIVRTSLQDCKYAVENGKIALRMPGTEWLRDGIGKAGSPVTATSANIAGAEYIHDFSTIFQTFNKRVNYFVCGSNSSFGDKPSTIVDLSGYEPEILRNPLNLDKESFLV